MNNRYQVNQSFEYNKEHGPFEEIEDKNAEIKELLGDEYGIEADFFGFKTHLPLGVAAGPLYNIRYMRGAARDGFSVITWKTYRSVNRLAHRNEGDFLGHNIVFIESDQFTEGMKDSTLNASVKYNGPKEKVSITNSFGMPSQTPDKWMPEITAFEKEATEMDKQVITSVVGSPQEGDTVVELGKDFAYCAQCAVEAGTSIVEINFSCPNVKGKEGSIFKNPKDAALISKQVREAIGKDTKLLIKVGFCTVEEYVALLKEVDPFVDGFVAINTIPMKVVDDTGKQALPGGLTSGLCGYPILDMAVQAVKNLREAREQCNSSVHIFGCGGVTSPEAAMKHLDAGAEFVFVGTAALFNPELPVQFAKYLRDHKIKRKING